MTHNLFSNKTLKLVTFCALPLLIAGCTKHLSQDDCLSNNMYQLGLMDGNGGKSINQFSRYQTDCNQFNINLDEKQYQKGWNKGNISYCQPQMAFQLGRDGQGYLVVCTDNNARELRHAYDRGFQIHQRIMLLENRIDSINNELNSSNNIEDKIENVQNRISDRRRDLDHANSQEAKNEINRDIERLKDELDMLKTKLIVSAAMNVSREKTLRDERDELQSELEHLKTKR